MSVAAAIVVTGVLWAWSPLDPPVRWADPDPALAYCIDDGATQTAMAPEEVAAAIEAGAAAWRGPDQDGTLSCTAATLVRRRDGCRPVTDPGDGVLNVHFVTDWPFGSATLGVTRYRTTANACGSVTDDTGQPWSLGCHGGADIELNDDAAWWGVGGSVGADLASVAAHELGHALGLGHCSDNQTCALREAVMHASYPGGVLRTPQADDVEGLCALYPRSALGPGALCESDAECESGVCAAGRGAVRRCSTLCPSAPCPSGLECVEDDPPGRTACRPAGPGAPACDPCDPSRVEPCAPGAVCVTDDGPAICRALCPDGDCPDGFLCRRRTAGTDRWVCVPPSGDCADPRSGVEPAGPIEPCVNVSCAGGGLCDSYCANPCDDVSDCAPDEVCASRIDRMVCLPEALEGEPCDDRTICASGVCVTAEPEDPICHRVCAGGGACAPGQSCEPRLARPGQAIEVCTPPPEPPDRPDAGVAIDAGGPGRDASEADAGQASCACAIGDGCAPDCICDLRCTSAPIEGSCDCRTSRGGPAGGLWLALLVSGLRLRPRSRRPRRGAADGPERDRRARDRRRPRSSG